MDQTSKNIVAGVIISLCGILVGVIIALIIKMLSQDVNVVTILFYRFTFSLPLLLCFACYKRGKEFYKINNKRIMFLRIVFGLAGLIFWILAIRSLALGLATALFHSSVIFVSFLAPFFLSEKTTAKQLLASITGLLGVVLLTNPNSRHGEIFLINLASEVPPVVENFGDTLVTLLIMFLAINIVLFGLVKKEAPLTVKSILNLQLFFLQIFLTTKLIFHKLFHGSHLPKHIDLLIHQIF